MLAPATPRTTRTFASRVLLSLPIVAFACTPSPTSATNTPSAVSSAPSKSRPAAGDAKRFAAAEESRNELARAIALYQLGEAAWAGENHLVAVGFWQASFRAIPDPPDDPKRHDDLRGALVERIATALIRLNELDADPYHLRAAEQILERWIAVRTAQLESTDGYDAREREAIEAECARLYALSAEVFSRLESPEDITVASAEAYERDAEQARARVQRTADGGLDAKERVDSHRGDTLGTDDFERDVKVDGDFASLDDPRVQAYLRHPDPLGPSLFDGGDEAFNPTRPIVRFSRLQPDPKVPAETRRHLWKRLDSVRPQLESCYISALMRSPEVVVRKRLRLRADGTGRLVVLDQGETKLGDAAGDACLERAFAQADVRRSELERVDVDLRIVFFIQPARYPTGSFLGDGATIGDTLGEYSGDRAPSFGLDSGSGLRGR